MANERAIKHINDRITRAAELLNKHGNDKLIYTKRERAELEYLMMSLMKHGDIDKIQPDMNEEREALLAIGEK